MHSGSALAFQARGAGSIPAIRSKKSQKFFSFQETNSMADVAKWLRQWIVTPPVAGSTPVIRLFQLKIFYLVRVFPFF